MTFFGVRYFKGKEGRPTGAQDFVTEDEAAAWCKANREHTSAVLFRLRGNRLLAYWDYKNQVWDYSKVKIVERKEKPTDD